MTHDEIIEIIKAHRDGKELQFRNALDMPWADTEAKSLEDLIYNICYGSVYRIKPQPREIWVNEYKRSGFSEVHFDSKEAADEYIKDQNNYRIACHKFIQEI